LSDCHGHMRTIEDLKRIWNSLRKKNPSYTELMRELTKRPFIDAPVEVVAAALQPRLVSIQEKIAGKTILEYISDGALLNTTKGESDFIPHLSPVYLMQWATRKIKALGEYFELLHAGDEGPLKAIQIAFCLDKMLGLETNFNWPQFEEFHVYWELLHRILCNTRVDLGAFYSKKPIGCVFNAGWKHGLVKQLSSHFGAAVSGGELSDPLSALFLCAPENPGFDAVSFEQVEPGKVLAICYEMKYSRPGAGTSLSADDVKKKVKLTEASFPTGLKVGSYEVVEHRLVIAAYRQASVDTKTAAKDVIVLDRDDLNLVYSPSLASRPQFGAVQVDTPGKA